MKRNIIELLPASAKKQTFEEVLQTLAQTKSKNMNPLKKKMKIRNKSSLLRGVICKEILMRKL